MLPSEILLRDYIADAGRLTLGKVDPNRLGDNPDSNKILYGDGSWRESTAPITLEELQDINISNVSDGDILKYDDATGRWVNGPLDIFDLPPNIAFTNVNNDFSTLQTFGGGVQIGSTASGPRFDTSSGAIRIRNAANTGFAPLQVGAITGSNGINLTLGNISIPDASYIQWSGGSSIRYYSSGDYIGVLKGSAAQNLKAGSLVISNSYTDTAPTNGLYSKGNVITDGTVESLGFYAKPSSYRTIALDAPNTGFPMQIVSHRYAYGYTTFGGSILFGADHKDGLTSTGSLPTIQSSGTSYKPVRWMSSAHGSIAFDVSYAVGGTNGTPIQTEDWTSVIRVLYSTGYVGIGNTSPTFKLDVGGSFRSSGRAVFGNSNVGDNAYTSIDAANSRPIISLYDSSGNESFRLAASSSHYVFGTIEDLPITFRTNGSDRMRLDNVSLYPNTNGAISLGINANRWSNVFSQAGNFSANLIVGGTTRLDGPLLLPTNAAVGSILYCANTSGNAQWTTPSTIGIGDVSSSTTSTDNAVARFDGTTGKVIQDSIVSITDGGTVIATGLQASYGININNASTNAQEWIIYHPSSDSRLFIRDAINSRQHITFSPGSSVATSTTMFHGNIFVDGDIVFSPTGTRIKGTSGTLTLRNSADTANASLVAGSGTFTGLVSGSSGASFTSSEVITNGASQISLSSSNTGSAGGARYVVSNNSGTYGYFASYGSGNTSSGLANTVLLGSSGILKLGSSIGSISSGTDAVEVHAGGYNRKTATFNADGSVNINRGPLIVDTSTVTSRGYVVDTPSNNAKALEMEIPNSSSTTRQPSYIYNHRHTNDAFDVGTSFLFGVDLQPGGVGNSSFIRKRNYGGIRWTSSANRSSAFEVIRVTTTGAHDEVIPAADWESLFRISSTNGHIVSGLGRFMGPGFQINTNGAIINGDGTLDTIAIRNSADNAYSYFKARGIEVEGSGNSVLPDKTNSVIVKNPTNSGRANVALVGETTNGLFATFGSNYPTIAYRDTTLLTSSKGLRLGTDSEISTGGTSDMDFFVGGASNTQLSMKLLATGGLDLKRGSYLGSGGMTLTSSAALSHGPSQLVIKNTRTSVADGGSMVKLINGTDEVIQMFIVNENYSSTGHHYRNRGYVSASESLRLTAVNDIELSTNGSNNVSVLLPKAGGLQMMRGGISTPSFTMTTGAGSNKVFVSDSSGFASWADLGTIAGATYVPYTGATGAVDLGSQNLSTTGIINTPTLKLGSGIILKHYNHSTDGDYANFRSSDSSDHGRITMGSGSRVAAKVVSSSFASPGQNVLKFVSGASALETDGISTRQLDGTIEYWMYNTNVSYRDLVLWANPNGNILDKSNYTQDVVLKGQTGNLEVNRGSLRLSNQLQFTTGPRLRVKSDDATWLELRNNADNNAANLNVLSINAQNIVRAQYLGFGAGVNFSNETWRWYDSVGAATLRDQVNLRQHAEFFPGVDSKAAATTLNSRLIVNNRSYFYTGTHNTVGEIPFFISSTIASSTGTHRAFHLTNTYTQTGTAASNDIFVSRVNTSLGSGSHFFMNLMSDGSSKFTVDIDGNTVASGMFVAPMFRSNSNGLKNNSSSPARAYLLDGSDATSTYHMNGSMLVHRYMDGAADFGTSLLFNAHYDYESSTSNTLLARRKSAAHTPVRWTASHTRASAFEIMTATTGAIDADIVTGDWTSRLKVSSITGNVGIGITNPLQSLHVLGTGLFTESIRLSTNSGPEIRYMDNRVALRNAANTEYASFDAYSATFRGNLEPLGGITWTTSGSLTAPSSSVDIRSTNADGGLRYRMQNDANYIANFTIYGSNYGVVESQTFLRNMASVQSTGALRFSSNVDINNGGTDSIYFSPGGTYNYSVEMPATGGITILRGGITTPTLTVTIGAGVNKVLSSDATGNALWTDLSVLADSTYVPYTGATSTVNLGSQKLVTSGNIQLGGTTGPQLKSIAGSSVIEARNSSDTTNAVLKASEFRFGNDARFYIEGDRITAKNAGYTANYALNASAYHFDSVIRLQYSNSAISALNSSNQSIGGKFGSLAITNDYSENPPINGLLVKGAINGSGGINLTSTSSTIIGVGSELKMINTNATAGAGVRHSLTSDDVSAYLSAYSAATTTGLGSMALLSSTKGIRIASSHDSITGGANDIEFSPGGRNWNSVVLPAAGGINIIRGYITTSSHGIRNDSNASSRAYLVDGSDATTTKHLNGSMLVHRYMDGVEDLGTSFLFNAHYDYATSSSNTLKARRKSSVHRSARWTASHTRGSAFEVVTTATGAVDVDLESSDWASKFKVDFNGVAFINNEFKLDPNAEPGWLVSRYIDNSAFKPMVLGAETRIMGSVHGSWANPLRNRLAFVNNRNGNPSLANASSSLDASIGTISYSTDAAYKDLYLWANPNGSTKDYSNETLDLLIRGQTGNVEIQRGKLIAHNTIQIGGTSGPQLKWNSGTVLQVRSSTDDTTASVSATSFITGNNSFGNTSINMGNKFWIYHNVAEPNLYIRDLVNERMHVTFSPNTTVTNSSTNIYSKLVSYGPVIASMGMYLESSTSGPFITNNGGLVQFRNTANSNYTGIEASTGTFTGAVTANGGISTQSITLTTGAGAGKILFSDSSGLGIWTEPTFENRNKLSFISVNVTTTAATAAKVGTTTSGTYFPQVGDILEINFTAANTAAAPTLNIDGSGAVNIRLGNVNATALETSGATKFYVVYDGTYYQMLGAQTNTNTVYSAMSLSELTTGTVTSSRVIAAKTLNDWVGSTGFINKLLPSQTGNSGYLLSTNGTDTSWTSPSSLGFGDVTGSLSSTDNSVVRFDGTTGKIIQDSLVTIDDTGNMSVTGKITAFGGYHDFAGLQVMPSGSANVVAGTPGRMTIAGSNSELRIYDRDWTSTGSAWIQYANAGTLNWHRGGINYMSLNASGNVTVGGSLQIAGSIGPLIKNISGNIWTRNSDDSSFSTMYVGTGFSVINPATGSNASPSDSTILFRTGASGAYINASISSRERASNSVYGDLVFSAYSKITSPQTSTDDVVIKGNSGDLQILRGDLVATNQIVVGSTGGPRIKYNSTIQFRNGADTTFWPIEAAGVIANGSISATNNLSVGGVSTFTGLITANGGLTLPVATFNTKVLSTNASGDVVGTLQTTTSTNDTSVGRLLRVGDFGLGGNGPQVTASALFDNSGATASGFYSISSTEVLSVPHSAYAHSIRVQRTPSTYATLHLPYGTSTRARTMSIRSVYSGGTPIEQVVYTSGNPIAYNTTTTDSSGLVIVTSDGEFKRTTANFVTGPSTSVANRIPYYGNTSGNTLLSSDLEITGSGILRTRAGLAWSWELTASGGHGELWLGNSSQANRLSIKSNTANWFLGTESNTPLVFRVNGTNRLTLPTAGGAVLTGQLSTDTLSISSGAANGRILVSDGAGLGTWTDISSISSIGDMKGPASSTAGAIATFQGVDGKTILSSSASIDGLGNASFTGVTTTALTLSTGGGAGKLMSSDSAGNASWIDNNFEQRNRLSFISVNIATAAATVAKVGTTTAGGYVPTAGDILELNFTAANTAASPTLNIDGSGAKNIRLGNVNATALELSGATKFYVVYDGTYYQMLGAQTNTNTNTTYAAITLAELQTGTATTARTVTAKNLTDWVTDSAFINKIVPSQTGNNGYFLKTDGSAVSWESLASLGTGDVTGPSSSTDNAIARFDSTTGKLLQNSVVTIGDNGSITTPSTISAGQLEISLFGATLGIAKPNMSVPVFMHNYSGAITSASYSMKGTVAFTFTESHTTIHNLLKIGLTGPVIKNISSKLSIRNDSDSAFYDIEAKDYYGNWAGDTIPVSKGGTGATTAAAARTSLGLATIASSASASDLTTGTLDAARLPSSVVQTSGSYSNPSWITSLDWSKLSNVPASFTPASHSHTIADTTGLQDALDNLESKKKLTFIPIAVSTAASTVAKVGVGPSGYTPAAGDLIEITFTAANTAAAPTLNINSSGAKNIRLGNVNVTAADMSGALKVYAVYDGTYYQLLGSQRNTDTNTTYSATTVAELQAGTVTTSRVVTPKVLSDWVKDSTFINSILPSQTGQAGKILTSDGNTVAWMGSSIPGYTWATKPSASGNTGPIMIFDTIPANTIWTSDGTVWRSTTRTTKEFSASDNFYPDASVALVQIVSSASPTLTIHPPTNGYDGAMVEIVCKHNASTVFQFHFSIKKMKGITIPTTYQPSSTRSRALLEYNGSESRWEIVSFIGDE